MAILIDTRIKRFVEGHLDADNENIMCIRLKDIDESFWFSDEILAQEFLNIQAIERVYDKELRKGYFDYVDENGLIHRYFIHKVERGKIISFKEWVLISYEEVMNLIKPLSEDKYEEAVKVYEESCGSFQDILDFCVKNKCFTEEQSEMLYEHIVMVNYVEGEAWDMDDDRANEFYNKIGLTDEVIKKFEKEE